MNNIFKVIWNHATQTWTAVGELASAKGKSKSIKLAAISTALLGSVSGVQAATHTAADSLIAISDDSAAGTTAIPTGEQAKATGKDSIAVGKKAAAGENGNVEGATAIGHGANAETNDSLAIGSGANVIMSANKALNKRSIAIGSQARVEPRPDGGVSNGAHDAIAIGTRATATAGNSVVIGRDARSKRGLVATFQSGEDTVAIGSNASADWGSSIAIGANSRTIVGNGIAIGRDATAMYKIDNLANDGEGLPFTSMALGEKATSIGGASIAAGIETKSAGVKSIAVGNKAFANGLQSIAIGDKTYSSDRSSIAMGAYAETGWNSAQRAIAIGRQAHAATTDASAFGSETFSGGVRSTAIGTKANTYGNQTLAVGSSTQNGVGPMAISENAMVFGTDSRSIGSSTIALGNEAIAGVTEADANTIREAYKTYRSAYNTYSNLNKAVNSADADDYAAKTNLSTEAQNLKLLIDRYNETGTIYQAENNKIQKELADAGITFSELTTLAGKLTASGQADVGNAQPMLDNEALINKIAAIENTETGKANEHLAYLVNLAKRLQNGITKAKTAQDALSTAKTAQTAGKATYDEAKKVFEATYSSGKSKTGAIAIGRSSLAAAEKSVALGDDAEVLSKDSTNAFAAAKNAKVYGTSPNAVVIGADAKAGLTGYTTRLDGVKRYGSTDAPNATAVGSSNHVLFEKGSAFGYNNKVRGKSAGAFGVNNIVGEDPVWTAKGDNAAIISPKEGQSGENSFVVGSNNRVWASNVMVLGNNIRVYGIGTRKENRENAVVLGNNSDGAPTVKKVNSANVNGMVYSGFKGNLGATKTDGSEAEKADLALQGRFVSIGTETTDKDGTTVYGERQIKHVASGEISSTSTDAINGSQLYAVASGLRDAFPVVYTDSDGNKVVKYPDGKYYPEGTVNIDGQYYPAGTVKIGDKYYPAGTMEDNVGDATEVSQIQPIANVIASMNNPTNTEAGKAGNNVTLTNVAQGANTIAYDKDGNQLVKVGDQYYAVTQLNDGKLILNPSVSTAATEAELTALAAPDTTKTAEENLAKKLDGTVKAKKTGLADLEHSVNSNAITVTDAKNLGFVVSTGNDGYADKVTNANEVRFNGKDGIKVTGETDEKGIRHINISLEKGEVVKKGEYNIGGTTYVNLGGKLYKREDVDFSGETPTAKQGKQPSNYTVNADGKVVDNTTTTPVEVSNVDKGNHFVDGNTVYKAIQESGWTVGKAKDAFANDKFQNADEKVNPNDELRFADGKGITVKTATVDEVNTKGEKQTTTVVKFDTDLPIDYANVKNAAGDNLKQANDGNWYKETDVNSDGTVKLDNGNKPTPETAVKSGATLSDANSNMGKNPYRTAIEDKAMAAAIEKVRGENPTATVEQLLPKVLEEAAKQVAELEKAEKAGKDKDVINAGKDGVQLNNVGWAENPDQAVNKDQLDQTVNKSGFFVQQNGKTTVEKDPNKEETDPAKSEKVTPNDVVNFVNGKGTVIKAVTKRDTATGVDTTTVSVDVDTSTLSLPKGANTIAYNDKGEPIVNVDGKYYKAGDLTNGKPNTGAVEQTPVTPATDKPVDQAKNGLIDLNNSNGGNAITISDAKNLGWVVSTSDNNIATAVKNADVVDFKAEAGTGLTVKGKSENGKMTVTVGNDYIKANATGNAAKATGTNSVAIGGNSNAAVEDAVAIGNGATVEAEAAKGSVAIGAGAKAGKANVGSYSIDPSATVAGKTGPDTRVVSVGDKGNEAQIQNVAPGVISATSTDAVNGSQLHATNVQVNNNAQNINRVEGKVDNLSQVINNHAGEFNRLDRKVNKYGKEARAGIAGANAAAALPQVYTPGKSMVAASAGTFKGQNALAVGYSRASDNGKVILKLQGNANTSGDVGAGVGVGYQW
ncbi:YadA-like family protein [Haemophilus haemolyticus]|uniref:YadA-like family protein n=1 Tax=Haemophilus haemolyticus TaxID=726 RepID=UPI000E58C3A3|nr:YadA-like family protein [Haemophilus haemolyticus]